MLQNIGKESLAAARRFPQMVRIEVSSQILGELALAGTTATWGKEGSRRKKKRVLEKKMQMQKFRGKGT